MHCPRFAAFTLFFGILFSTHLIAKKLDLSFDESSGKVGFSIIKFKIGGTVEGQFDEFKGTATIDPETNSLTQVRATIATTSVNTDEKKRDKHLRDEDFFHVEKYPTMTFASTQKRPLSKKFSLPGELTMKGVTKPVTLVVEPKKIRDGEYSFSITTELNRLDYNVSWNKDLEQGDWKEVFGILGKTVLDERVKVMINVKATKRKKKVAQNSL